MSELDQVRAGLPRDAAAPSQGRDAVRLLLGDHVPLSFTSDAVLATSELVTNALVHTHGGIELLAQFDRRRCLLRVEVSDSSSDVPQLRTPVPNQIGGVGLRVVAEVSSAWGCALTEFGKHVWFELMSESGAPPGGSPAPISA
jgi:anti-sigma regulatory factor (Ser/Thr protein kinase)